MTIHNFDDRPLLDPKFDRLGFEKPAQSLAALLARTAAPEGFVAAVTGQWGEGKSTFLNFVKMSDSLSTASRDLPRLEIITFDPWLVSGHQDLVRAFFKYLADELKTKWDVTQSLAKSGGKATIEAGKKVVDNGLAEAAAKIALLADGGLLVQSVSILAKKSLDEAAKSLTKEPSLQKAYMALSKRLKDSNRRFLVVIDEIDRLSPDEIRTMMNMVKSVGRLPNVIYLLSYDQTQVHKVLGGGDIVRGHSYAEKIVQHEFSLPTPLPDGVLKMLDERIGNLIGETEDDMRWHRYVSSGVRRWVRKPRDVIRLSAAFNFVGEQLKDEVNLQDVLILEGFRLYQTNVFDWIKRNDSFLFGTRTAFLSDHEKTASGQALADLIAEEDRDDTLTLIANLFPQIAQCLPGQQNTNQTQHYLAKIKGFVQTEEAYRTYFAAGLPEGSIPRATLDMLASPTTTVERFNEVFASLDIADPKFSARVSAIVEAVRYRVEDNAQEMPFAVLDGLGHNYEKIDQAAEVADIFQSPLPLLVGTVRTCLLAWGKAHTSDYIRRLLGASASLDFKTLVVAEVSRSLGVIPSDSHETQLVTTKEFEEIKKITLKQILDASSNGDLVNARDIYRSLNLWAIFDDTSAAKKWIHNQIASNKHVLYKLSRALVSRTLGKNVEYTLRDDPGSDYIDLKSLMDAAKAALCEDVSEDEKKLFTEIVEGGQKLLTRAASQSPKPYRE